MCAKNLLILVAKASACAALVLAASVAAASDRKLYASAVDVDPWSTCEKLSETSAFRGLGRTVYRDRRFACEGESRSEPISAATVCQRQLGLSRSGLTVTAIIAVDAASRPSFVRCLYDEVDASCLTPTKELPGWPQPVFASPTDERCDLYRRGPVSEPPRNKQVREKNRIDLSSFNDPVTRAHAAQALQLQQKALAELRIQPPRLLPLWVTNTLVDESGRPVQSPQFPLRRVLDERPTIGVTWWPGCQPCDEVIRLLHEQDPFYIRQATAHPAPRIAILFPTQGPEQDQALRQKLRQQYPGRASWAVVAGFQFARVNARQQPLPQVLVFDARGLLRATTYASAFDHAEAAGWTLVREPALLLNAALEEGYWQGVPQQATLQEVAIEVARGRLAGSVGEAPDVIRLEPALADAMASLGRRGYAEKREFGAQLLLDRGVLRLGNVNAGGAISVRIVPEAADFRALGDRAGCTACSGDVLTVGKLHTHPYEGWHSPKDLQNAGADSLSVVAMPSGALVMTMATHEQLLAYRPVNRDLEDPQLMAYERAAQRLHLDAYSVRLVDAAPVDFASAMPIRRWAAPSLGLGQPPINMAALVAGYARTLGLATYVGYGSVLHKVSPTRNAGWLRSWTGSEPASGSREERNLNDYDRIIIARLLRSMLGDKDALCTIRSADIRPISAQAERWTSTFTPEVRGLIRAAAAEAARQRPDWPPLASAREGYLDDHDLPYLLELVQEKVEVLHGYFMRRDDRRCLLTTVPFNRGGGQSISDVSSILVWGRAEHRDGHLLGGGDIRDFKVADTDYQGIALGDDARYLGCANVALLQGNPFTDAATRGKVTCDRLLRPPKPGS
jgi:hypothetical protein